MLAKASVHFSEDTVAKSQARIYLLLHSEKRFQGFLKKIIPSLSAYNRTRHLSTLEVDFLNLYRYILIDTPAVSTLVSLIDEIMVSQ